MAVSDPNQLCPKWGPLNKYDLLDYIDYYKSSKRRAPRWYHHPNILNLPKHTMEMNLFPIVYSHWIGWKEHLQENGIFHGNIHWYIWPKSDPKIQLVSIDIFNIHGYIDKIWYFHCLVPIDPKKSPDFVLFVLKSPPRSRKRRWRRSRRSTSHGFMWETRCHKELPLGMIHTYSYHIHTHNRYIYIYIYIQTYIHIPYLTRYLFKQKWFWWWSTALSSPHWLDDLGVLHGLETEKQSLGGAPWTNHMPTILMGFRYTLR